jgi:hypothetical protein
MDKDKPETAVLPRNFTVTTEERMRALAAGPPAYARRLRRIEDLEVAIVRAMVDHEAESGELLDAAALPELIGRKLEQLNRLIDDHNRYYPIEAGLRIDLRTRRLIDWGEPWEPRPKVAVEVLIAAARRQKV